MHFWIVAPTQLAGGAWELSAPIILPTTGMHCAWQHVPQHPKALASTTTRSASSCTMSFTHTVKMPARRGMKGWACQRLLMLWNCTS